MSALAKFVAGPVALADAPGFPNPKDARVSKLMCADVGGNNNKFYSLFLQESSKGQWRVLINYGRVGQAGRFEVRGHGASRADAEEVFEDLHREKTRPSKKSGTARYREVQIVDPTPGTAVALRPKAGGIVQAQDAWRSGARAPASWSADPQRFYNALLHEAQCLVETGMGASSVSSAGLQTPLGIVGESDIREAQKVLEEIARLVPLADTASQTKLVQANSMFYKIIPTPIGGTRVKLKDMMITTSRQVADKQQLLDSALGLIAAQQPATGLTGGSYPFLLEDVDADEGRLLTEMLRAQQCKCHDNRRLSWAAAFRVTRPADVARFRKDLAQNDLLLFHGTRRTTAAGILSRGLLPTRAATAAGGSYSGSAFGDGVYFAKNSGKSLGYTGASDGKRILFVALVAMGRTQVHNGRSSGSFRRGIGFDSVHAVGGNDLAHDEMIVPSADQACLAYVLEA